MPDSDPADGRRIVPGVAILDAHAPIRKTVHDPAAASPDNPEGASIIAIGATPEELEAMARAGNERVALDRPAAVQIGHTQPGEADLPEPWLPRKVGHLENYRVEDREGRPHLVADLHIDPGQYDECRSYPRLSIERVLGDGRDDGPNGQYVDAVALLRRPPERDLPMIPYAAGQRDPAARVVQYARECLPSVPYAASPEDPDRTAESGLTLDPTVEPPPMALETADIEALVAALVPALAAAMKPAEAPAPSAADPTVNYDADGNPTGAPGGDSVVIPDDDDETKKKMATYAKAALGGEISRLGSALNAIQAKLDEVAGTVGTLDEENQRARINYQTETYGRLLDEAEAAGVVIDREAEMETVMALPVEKRVVHLQRIKVNYARAPFGGRIPSGGLGRKGKASPEYRQARIDYGTKHGITDFAELDLKFAEVAPSLGF